MSRSIDPSDLSCARLTPFQGDVTKKEDVERVVAAIPDLVGVVHAAGVGYGGPFAMTNEDDAKTLFARHRAGVRTDGLFSILFRLGLRAPEPRDSLHFQNKIRVGIESARGL